MLPQYSGGLGILAGDHLKAASDLGVPIIGVGLLYRQGYFRQSLNAAGWQQERYPLLDPNSLPLTQLHGDDGPVRIEVPLGSRTMFAQVWLARVGRVPLLLLDSDVEQNGGYEREVTDRLYGGGTDHRLAQEVLLGIGGVRAIRAYCSVSGAPAPEVFHTNEGHAGFLGLERIREYMHEGMDFDTALERSRAGTVFTTHTPVPAGIDRFPRELIVDQFSNFDVPLDRVLALGAEDYVGGDPSKFNMAVMGFRLGQRANGVSLLHGAVSREMFQGLWPAFDTSEVPITSITNGVHHLTWVHRDLLELAGAADRQPVGDRCRRLRLGGPRARGRQDHLGAQAQDAPGADHHGPSQAGREQRQPRSAVGVGEQRPRPGHRHLRLRAPGALVQAADLDAAEIRGG